MRGTKSEDQVAMVDFSFMRKQMFTKKNINPKVLLEMATQRLTNLLLDLQMKETARKNKIKSENQSQI